MPLQIRQDTSILSTSRTKRWNGTLESLAADYLKDVAERMESYGDRVQFELPGHSKRPIYQVIGRGDRKMGFDGKHLLLRLNENGNVAETLSAEFTLEAVRQAILGKRSTRGNSSTRASSSRPVRQRAAAPAAAVDTIEQDKYAYYRAHRETLPDGISQYANEISQLMRSGKSAEAAFQQIIEQHYKEA